MDVDAVVGKWGLECSAAEGGGVEVDGVLVDVKGGGVEGGGVRWMNNAGSPPSFSNLGPANPRK